jgi:hypothetical protein
LLLLLFLLLHQYKLKKGQFHFLLLLILFFVYVILEHIYYSDFADLLSEYREPKTSEEKIIKAKLNAIVDIIENCIEGEGLFADEITLNFSHIIALIKNKYQKELIELTQKCECLQAQVGNSKPAYIPQAQAVMESEFEYDREVLEAFYNHFIKEGQLSYWQIDEFQFESDVQRKKLVNLTLRDYCNRVKTFSKRYLFEIFPEDSIPKVIHGEDADEYDSKTRLQADEYAQTTRAKADEYSELIRMDADGYARGIREELAAQKAELDEKKKSLYAEAEAESERIRTEADEYSKNIRAEADQYRMDAQKVVKELVSNHEWLMKGLQ